MAKTKISRKEIKRLKQKDAFAQATEVRLLAERLPNQAALDTCLLQCPDVEKRRKLFNFMKGFLKFPNPQFPSTIESPSIIMPGR